MFDFILDFFFSKKLVWLLVKNNNLGPESHKYNRCLIRNGTRIYRTSAIVPRAYSFTRTARLMCSVSSRPSLFHSTNVDWLKEC